MPVISVVYWWCWYLCHFKFAVSLWFSASLLLERYWRYYVVRLSVSACTCMLVFLSLCPEVYDHDVLETTWGNSTKFTTLVHSGTKMIWGQRSKVVTRPSVVKNLFSCHFVATEHQVSIVWIELDVLQVILGKTGSKGHNWPLISIWSHRTTESQSTWILTL